MVSLEFSQFQSIIGSRGRQNDDDDDNKVFLQRLNSDVFFYCFFHALCCIVLFIETSTCTHAKRPTLEGVRMDGMKSACGGRGVDLFFFGLFVFPLHVQTSELKSFLLEMERNHI